MRLIEIVSTPLLLLSVFCVVSLLIRGVTIFFSSGWFSRGFAGDSSVHLQIIKQLKKKSKKIMIENYVIPNKMTYPILFHRFCCLFPTSFIKKYSFVPNLLIYVVSFLFFLIVSLNYLQISKIGNQIYFFTAFLLLQLLSIQNLVSAGPAIAYIKLSSRLLAKVACAFFVCFLFFHLEFNYQSCFFIASIFAAVGFLSGTFAAQFLLFFCVLHCTFSMQFTAFLILATGLLLSIVLSSGYSLRSITGMVKYWKIYFSRVKRSRYTAPVLSSLINLKEILLNLKNKKFKNILKHIYKREPTRALIYYPETIFIIFLITFINNDFLQLNTIYISVLVIYLLTSCRIFNFLGESYRYLEYGLFYLNPIALFLLFGLNNNNINDLFYLIGFVVYTIMCSILINYLFGHTKQSATDNLTVFISKLNISKNEVVFPVSMRLGADIVARTECKSFWWQPGGITDISMYDDYLHEYPYLSLNWRKLCEEHNVDYIIVDKLAESRFEDRYNFSDLNVIHQDDYYKAYKYS